MMDKGQDPKDLHELDGMIFMFWHCVESGKSKMRVVGVVEARYGYEQKVGGT